MKLLKSYRKESIFLGIFFLTYLLITVWLVFGSQGYKTVSTVPTKKLPTSSATTSALNNKNFNFIVFGDSGVGSQEQKDLAVVMAKWKFDLILHTGDLAYPMGTPDDIQKNVVDIYQTLFAKASFYPSLGNHDYGTDNGQPYLDTWQLPENERYYSFVYNDVLFLSIDSNAPLNDPSGEEVAWLTKTLSDNTKIKWKIAYFHHPPFQTRGVHSSDKRVQERIVPILEKYGVDLVFSGHEHNYQRTCLIQANTCQKAGVLYIVTGGGGAPLYRVGKPEWFTAKQISAHHFVFVEKVDCRLEASVVSSKEEILDQFSVNKCN